MANELELYGVATGQTIVAQLFLAGVQEGSNIACAEVGGVAYVGSVPGGTAEAGYTVRFLNTGSGATVAHGELDWDGEREWTPRMLRQLQANDLRIDFGTQALQLRDDVGNVAITWALETDAGEPVATVAGAQTKRLAPAFL